MQLVHDGPDWLYAQWPVLDGADHDGSDRYATLVLRDDAKARAEDIAVMAFALLRIPEWQQLTPWWEPHTDRAKLRKDLHHIAQQYAGEYKLAIVQTASGVDAAVREALHALGFAVVEFTPTEVSAAAK